MGHLSFFFIRDPLLPTQRFWGALLRRLHPSLLVTPDGYVGTPHARSARVPINSVPLPYFLLQYETPVKLDLITNSLPLEFEDNPPGWDLNGLLMWIRGSPLPS